MPLLDCSVLPGAGGAAQFLPNSTAAPPFQRSQPLLSMFGKRETDNLATGLAMPRTALQSSVAATRLSARARCPSNSIQRCARCARRRGYQSARTPSSSDQCNVFTDDLERCNHSLCPVLQPHLVGRPHRSRKAGRAGAASPYRQNRVTGAAGRTFGRQPSHCIAATVAKRRERRPDHLSGCQVRAFRRAQ